jgi:twitching motility protein PilT
MSYHDNAISMIISDLYNRDIAFSDIRIETESLVKYRTPNGWEDANFGIIGTYIMDSFIRTVRPDWQKEIVKNGGAIDFAINADNLRVRCNIYTTSGGDKVAMNLRVLPDEVPSIREIGLSVFAESFAQVRSGLLLVSGPTGSGKTTTMAAIAQSILSQRKAHVVTIEHPIEYALKDGLGIVTQREVGIDTAGFKEGLEAAMRQSPDVIIVGEIRDKEAAETAIRAAEHGIYVIVTTHASDSVGALGKILSFFNNEEMRARSISLSENLVGVIHQNLLPGADKKKFVLGYELLTAKGNPQVKQMIADIGKHKQLADALASGQISRSASLNTTLADLVRKEKITRETAMAASYHPTNLQDMLK